jgi:hypothetical protein
MEPRRAEGKHSGGVHFTQAPPKSATLRGMHRRVGEAFLAVVLEESVRRFLPGLLPYAWLLILAGLTFEVLRCRSVRGWVQRRYAPLSARLRMASIIVAVAVGSLLLLGYWQGINLTLSWLQGKESVSTESLMKKYPMGYSLFTGDTQTTFVRKNNESKADFSLDWESCRITFADASFVDIALKDFHYHPTEIEIENLDVVLQRKVGIIADGIFFNGAGLFVELLDDRNDEIVYVIGLKKVNSIPKIRDLNPEVQKFIGEHLHKPMVSAIDTNVQKYIRIENLVMSSGWVVANK